MQLCLARVSSSIQTNHRKIVGSFSDLDYVFNVALNHWSFTSVDGEMLPKIIQLRGREQYSLLNSTRENIDHFSCSNLNR